MKITVRVFGIDGPTTKNIEARELQFKGFEAYRFAYHHSTGKGVEHLWTITEVSTGLMVGEGRTLGAAREYARSILKRVGTKGLKKRIAEMLANLPNEAGK